ncbi:MAG TPA: hypothetical protein VF773_01685 [Verrucomicrobiae bacterium]
MKGRLNVRKLIATSAVVASLNGINSHAGFLDILRGEPVEPQRVAFIGAARVQEVSGTVERLSGIDRWTAVENGEVLKPGDMIRTTTGTAIVRMTESGSFVKVTPNTVLRLVPAQEEDRSLAQGIEEREGLVVRSCRGKAYFATESGEWEPVEVNQVIARGAQLRTEAGAMLDLFDTQSKRPVRVPGAVRLKLDDQALASRVAGQPSIASAQR